MSAPISTSQTTTNGALESGEAQDSQAVWANVMADIGANLAGHVRDTNEQAELARHRIGRQLLPVTKSKNVNSELASDYHAANETTIDCSLPDTRDSARYGDSARDLLAPLKPSRAGFAPVSNAAPSQRLSKAGVSNAAQARMEETYQTPTQVNQDRNYDDVFKSQDDVSDQNAAEAPRTLEPGDTGAVIFANLSPSSAVSEDKGFEDSRGAWRNDSTSQLRSNNGHTPLKPGAFAPTTPALPKNPFGPKAAAGAPMGATQIFGQTQFSSAVKRVSPTSSRPSPNMLETVSSKLFQSSPSKKRDNVSSPSIMHPSSPSKPQDIPDTISKDDMLETIEEESPSAPRPKRANVVPLSPTYQPTSPTKRRPRERYEPMDKSQEQSKLRRGENAVVEDDSDEEFRRMNERKAKLARQRARAAEEMSSIMVPLQKSPDEYKRKRRKIRDDHDKNPIERPKGRTELRVSQSSPQVPSLPTVPPGNASDKDHAAVAPGNCPSDAETGPQEGDTRALPPDPIPGHLDTRSSGQDVIPATPLVSSAAQARPGPSGSEPDLPRLLETSDEKDASAEMGVSSSAPPTKRRLRPSYKAKQLQKTVIRNSPGNGLTAAVPEKQATEDEGTVELAGSSVKEVTEMSQPSKHHATKTLIPRTPAQPRLTVVGVDASSSSPPEPRPGTPKLSDESTTPTKETAASRKATSVASASPAHSHTLRRSLRAVTQSQSPKALAKDPNKSKRQQRVDSESTDELHREANDRAIKRASMAPHATSRASRAEPAPDRESLLLDSMVFGISLRSEQDQQRSQLVTRIRQAGGIVLEEGLQELFEVPETMKGNSLVQDEESQLQLKEEFQHKGFTAILADNNSRKPKYMQALALGIPCLAYQWISLCLSRNMILEWEPFLLAAGSSGYLGNALRSRNLALYDAEDAHLANIVDDRKRLLEGQSLLYVFDAKRSKNGSQQPHIFLAYALGPTITRVVTPQQARQILQERETSGNGFHYIYVDKDTCTLDAVFKTAGRNGRRGWAPWAYTVRPLNDELIIQSLIMGHIPSEEDLKVIRSF